MYIYIYIKRESVCLTFAMMQTFSFQVSFHQRNSRLDVKHIKHLFLFGRNRAILFYMLNHLFSNSLCGGDCCQGLGLTSVVPKFLREINYQKIHWANIGGFGVHVFSGILNHDNG